MSISIVLDNASVLYKVNAVNLIPDDIGGVYFFYNKDGRLAYVGRTIDLKKRLKEHLNGVTNTEKFYKEFAYFKYIFENDVMYQKIYEIYAINIHEPLYNIADVHEYDPTKLTMPIENKDKKAFINFVVSLLKTNRNTTIDLITIRVLCKESNIKLFDFYDDTIKKEFRKYGVKRAVGGMVYSPPKRKYKKENDTFVK